MRRTNKIFLLIVFVLTIIVTYNQYLIAESNIKIQENKILFFSSIHAEPLSKGGNLHETFKSLRDNIIISEVDTSAEITILNKHQTFYEHNPKAFILYWFVFIIMLIFMIGIMFVLNKLRIQNKQLIKAQSSVHSVEELIEKDIEIKRIKKQLEEIIDDASISYVLIADGIIIQSNNYAKNSIGIVDGTNAKNYCVDTKELERDLNMLQCGETIQGKMIQIKMKNGQIHRFHIGFTLLENDKKKTIISWGIDIEEIEIYNDHISQIKGELKRIIDGLPIPMIILKIEDDEMLYANSPYMKMFNSQTYEVSLMNIYNTFPEKQKNGQDSKELFHEYIEKSKKLNITNSWEWQYIVNNNIVHAIVYSRPIIYDDHSCIIIIIQDISDKKKEEELLRALAAKEKEANQLKSRFLFNMSHEIRTPMNAIVGFSEIELKRNPPNIYRDTFSKINKSAKILLNIIDDILDFSKIEAGKLDIIEEEFDLEDVIMSSVIVANERTKSEVVMLIDLDPRIPYTLIGDKTRLWQILKNLLDNSAKYTSQGMILLKVTYGGMAGEQTVVLTFSIEDTGMGMSKQQIKKLFVPFERFNKDEQYRYSGTGLGMPITKQLVELMKGTIKVNSQYKVGTQIQIKLNLGVKNFETIKETIKKQEKHIQNIMIVYDNEASCKIMTDLLNIIGVNTISIFIKDKVFDKVKDGMENNQAIDIVIVDFTSINDSIECIKSIKTHFSQVTKFMITSNSSKITSFKALKEININEIIERPFVPTQFINYICNAYQYVKEKDDIETNNSKYNYINNKEYPIFKDAKILLCEDNHLNQDVAIGMLEMFGIMPIIADNGEDAIKILEEEQFDLIFMDLLMPIMNGYETTYKIRSSQAIYKDIPIIAMTANVMKEDIERCINEGMNGHVAKPLKFEEIYNQLIKYLKEKI